MFNNNLLIYIQKNSRKKLYVFLLVCSALLFLSGCKSAELKALEDSASVIQLTTGQEVRRWARDKDWGFSGPIYPKVTIVYEPLNNYTKEEVYDEIITVLKKNNWEGSEPVTGRDYFDATLQQGGFEISTGVSVDENKNLVIIVMAIY